MEPLTARDPRRLGGYRLLARLGAGGMGRVYLGQRGRRLFALKVILGSNAADPEFRARFAREIQLARRVSGPFTAAVVDSDTRAEPPWLATEYVPAPALHTAVAHGGALPEPTLLALAQGLAEALDAIHGSGIVHRDLKPPNVLLGQDRPRVIDFGIAKALYDTGAIPLTPTGASLGTPGYMSPEQVLGGDPTPASDLFAMGAVLCFAATGRHPFGSGDFRAVCFAVLEADPPLDEVPDSLRPALARCLAKDPDRRGTTRDVLRQVRGRQPGAAEAAAWLPPPVEDLLATTRVELRELAPTLIEPDQPKLTRVETPPAQPPSPQLDTPPPEPPVRPAPILARGLLRLLVGAAAVLLVVAAAALFDAGAAPAPVEPEEIARHTVDGFGLQMSADATHYATQVTSLADVLDQYLELRDTRTGDVVAELPMRDLDPIVLHPLAVAADGGRVAMETDQGVMLWDTGSEDAAGLSTVLPYEGEVECEEHPTLSEWFFDRLPERRTCESTIPDERNPDFVEFSPDGQTMAVSGGGDQTELRGIDGQRIAVLGGDHPRTRAAAFSPDGALLATAGAEQVDLWHAETGEHAATLDGEDGAEANALAFSPSPDGALLATASDQVAAIWDAGTGEQVATLMDYGSPANEDLDGRFTAVAFSPDGSQVATGQGECRDSWYQTMVGNTCDRQGLMTLWDTDAGERLATVDHDAPSRRNQVEQEREELDIDSSSLHNEVHTAGFLAEGGALATADALGSLVLWQVG